MYGATIVVTPVLLWLLSRAFPVRAGSSVEYESLRSRHSSTELWAGVLGFIAMWAAIFIAIFARVGNTPWSLGVVFGWLVVVPVVVIALRTLPRGIIAWQELWRFHELRHRISLRLLGPLYTLLSVLGVISTAVLISRQ